ncbi:MAG TPA: hypothetical protein P5065_00665 [Candidatus Ratteibacteria bacterium]|nr:hypothetical protein [bacterium]HON05785.1 hypothetical protein [bacterium]HRS05541.1 hypothetical protein [Candidatus Ratteibacteria bacterium]HRV03620.1 hypothetical protein [Candidatus Ratteibacteria bacterium]
MIPVIKKRRVPNWLVNIDKELKGLSIKKILSNSLYYPASGRDGDPVRYLGGYVYSFIYVDYGLEYDEVSNSLEDYNHGFRGYRILTRRDVRKEELIPQGWSPILPNRCIDGDLRKTINFIKKPFALVHLQKRKNFDEEDGPSYFSFLFIGGDGVATFQVLYHGNKCSPDVVTIIQPGTGFGGNWTNFQDPEMIFAQSVLQNSYGRPSYLLYGGWGTKKKLRKSLLASIF